MHLLTVHSIINTIAFSLKIATLFLYSNHLFMFLKRYLIILLILASCNNSKNNVTRENYFDSSFSDSSAPIYDDKSPSITENNTPPSKNSVGKISSITPGQLVSYAKTLIGVPYRYASSEPSIGFDCSGFITYVFNHFNIDVPRSSYEFTNLGDEISIHKASEGDLILFTGTADSSTIVGHMGIVTNNHDSLYFIHSTSGRAYGVTVSTLTDHYKKRFVKIIRVFADSNGV